LNPIRYPTSIFGIRYGIRVFNTGEIGEIVDIKHPLTFENEPIYDYYIKFDNFKPIGIFKTEIEIVGEIK